MLLKSNIFGTAIPLHTSFESISERVPVVKLLQPLSILQTPALPERFNRRYTMHDGAVCNPYKAECSCSQFSENSKIFQGDDCNTLCGHLVFTYKRFAPSVLSPLHRHFLQMRSNGENHHYGIMQPETKVILAGYSVTDYWIKLATAEPARYSYHLKEQRWAHNTVPSDADELVLCLKNYFALADRR